MLRRVFERVLTALACVAAAIVVYTVLTIDYEVVMRYFFQRPTTWVIDFTEYALLYMVFLASAWVLRQEGHVNINLLLVALSPRVQRLLNAITSVIAAAACCVLFGFSLWVTWDAFVRGEVLWKSTIVPKWPIYIVMPIGSLLLTVQFLIRAWGYATARAATLPLSSRDATGSGGRAG
jgi:TRAP-type C4-dicarboxylate transport system permease small subunit